ncbi:M1 family peptidase [Chitinophaga sp. SYP-B3965]|uniref:M1 family metallopeptidase n=1 Tax=Chitinophaga sp. SYP-B3965 TaxID=2663120 RepID=UPI001299C980|nr:M1 family metallopeptidase [Chitinophaga sp. SYP-B3965]MRG44285.1 M1 family peptidase [Chitinophaga sp. SYP-B3965]
MNIRMILLFLLLAQYGKAQQSTIVGTYQFNLNPMRTFGVKVENDTLRFFEDPNLLRVMYPLGNNKYKVGIVKPEAIVEFVPGKMIVNQGGKDYDCFKIWDDPTFPKAKRAPNRQNGFTRADTLRGKLSPLRSCYDVTYYHLTVEVHPATRTLEGNSLIRFNTVTPFRELQVDLYENMSIDSILYKGQRLAYTREYDAVFIQFPAVIPQGSIDEFRVYYHGRPQEPDLSVSMNGGMLWRKDENGKTFAQIVMQGSGASVWWPNKDHLSDESDSTLISVIVPDDVQNISNGRLRNKVALPGNRTLTEWFVSYPINNYNIVFNIGDYTHFSDTYGDLTLDYYCLPNHLENARKLSAKVKPMLEQFEKHFGPYPFPRDGFKLIETVYPMEHQSCVALGGFQAMNGELERLMSHEVAHEWWGNNVSMKDFADFWLHEAFATYAEKIMLEFTKGHEAAVKALEREPVDNKEPMIGEYDVNHVHYNLYDVYSKGCRVIHTLRSVLNNDTLFFDILRGIQKDFAYQTVTTHDVETYISKKAGIDLSPFFDQYLRTILVPELAYYKKGGQLYYKWNNTIPGFKMPVRVTVDGLYIFIYPTDNWSTIAIKKKDIKVDTENFYVKVKEEKAR